MNRAEEIKRACLSVMSKDGIEDDFSVQMSESIATELIALGYVKFEQVCLDPQRCVQLLATILNSFRAEHPFAIMEADEYTQDDSAPDGEVSTEVVS